MVCLGLEPGAAEWKAQKNPLSYGGTQLCIVYVILFFWRPKKMKIPFLSERKFCFFGEKETLNSIEDFLKGGDLEYKKVLYSPSLAISCNQCDQIERF